jgi:hypothetical protein
MAAIDRDGETGASEEGSLTAHGRNPPMCSTPNFEFCTRWWCQQLISGELMLTRDQGWRESNYEILELSVWKETANGSRAAIASAVSEGKRRR